MLLSEKTRIEGIWFEAEQADAGNFAPVLLSFTLISPLAQANPELIFLRACHRAYSHFKTLRVHCILGLGISSWGVLKSWYTLGAKII